MILTDLLARIATLLNNKADRLEIIPLVSTAHDAAQMLESDERFTKLESQVSTLTTENKELRTQLQETNLTVDRLREQQEQKRSEDLPEPRNGLLVFINAHENPSIQQIAQHLGMSESGACFHLVELDREQFVYPENFTDGRQNWCLGQAGKKYLNERGLLR